MFCSLKLVTFDGSFYTQLIATFKDLNIDGSFLLVVITTLLEGIFQDFWCRAACWHNCLIDHDFSPNGRPYWRKTLLRYKFSICALSSFQLVADFIIDICSRCFLGKGRLQLGSQVVHEFWCRRDLRPWEVVRIRSSSWQHSQSCWRFHRHPQRCLKVTIKYLVKARGQTCHSYAVVQAWWIPGTLSMIAVFWDRIDLPHSDILRWCQIVVQQLFS